MRLELTTLNVSTPSLGGSILKRPLTSLNGIKKRNEERWGTSKGSPLFENRKERLRQRLQDARNPLKEIKKIQATEVGWQRLLISLYVESYGQDWLPPFDNHLAVEMFGPDGARWNPSRRRQASQLFFQRFDELPALRFLARQLRSAFDSGKSERGRNAGVWVRVRNTIFQSDGPQQIAASAAEGETLADLMISHGVPEKGQFSEKLRQVYLLETLQRCSYGSEPTVLDEIENEREKVAIDSLKLGEAALRILITRVESEGRRQWPDGWRNWIVRLGCDPRMGRHNAEDAKWWGWATQSQRNLAIQGIIGLSLQFFFDFLDGTVSVHQWEERREFLQDLFNSGKICDARLVLNQQCMKSLPTKMRDKWNTASLRSTTEDACIISLHCINDIYILEETHSYGLRAFHRTFPVKGFWERSRSEYRDNELRISPSNCPVFIRHSGDWVRNFHNKLRRTFHPEWSNIGS